MKNTLKYIIGSILALVVCYFAAFFILGWLAPHNTAINRFYSDKFYSLRCAYESDYINRLETHEGILRFSVSGDPGVLKAKGTGIGFIVPEALKEAVASIPDGSEVEVYIGKRLSRESIGTYHNELRRIIRK